MLGFIWESFFLFWEIGNDWFREERRDYFNSRLSIRFPIVTVFISSSNALKSIFWTDLICSPFLKRCISSQVSFNVEKMWDETITVLFNSLSFKMISVMRMLLWISTPLKGSSRIKHSFSCRRIAVSANFFSYLLNR